MGAVTSQDWLTVILCLTGLVVIAVLGVVKPPPDINAEEEASRRRVLRELSRQKHPSQWDDEQ